MCLEQFFQREMTKENYIEIPLCCKHMTGSLNIIISQCNPICGVFAHVKSSRNRIILQPKQLARERDFPLRETSQASPPRRGSSLAPSATAQRPRSEANRNHSELPAFS